MWLFLTGKNIFINANVDLRPATVPVNQSFTCYAELSADNHTAYLDTPSEEYTYPIDIKFNGIRLQAFNKVPSTKDFSKGEFLGGFRI